MRKGKEEAIAKNLIGGISEEGSFQRQLER